MAGVYYTAQGLSNIAGVSLATVRKALQEGRITDVIRADRRVLISDTDTQAAAWLESNGGMTAADIAAMKHELNNLRKRVKQAEAAQRRAEARELKALRQQANTAEAIAGTQAALAAVVHAQLEAAKETEVNAEVVD